MERQDTTTKSELESEISRLRKENAGLKSRIRKLEAVSEPRPRGSFWRTFGVITVTVLAGVLLLLGSLFLWAARSVADTDRYVAIVGPLVDQPEIQQAVATRASQGITNQVDIGELTREALPERAGFLAGPLEEQVVSNLNGFLLEAIGSDRFQALWLTTQREAHERLLLLVKTEGAASGILDINAIYTALSDELADSRLSVLANRDIPDRIGQIEVVESEWLGTVNFVATNLTWLRFLTLLGFVALTLLAIMLARNRRRAVTGVFTTYGFALLGMLVVLGIFQSNAGESVQAVYRPAFDAAWTTVFSGYTTQLVVMAVFAFLIAIVAWLGGGTPVAASARARVQQVFAGRLHEAAFGDASPVWTLTVARYRHVLRVAIAVIALTFLILEPITADRLFWTVLVALLVLAVLEFIAGKPDGGNRS